MKILVAGIGNIFLGDDGFGPAVADALRVERDQATKWPAGVEVADFGIRGMDLAFALTAGIDAAILVDAVARGGVPGTIYVIEPDGGGAATGIETHALDPARVLQFAQTLGPTPRFVRVVGCEPERLGGEDDDVAVGLSAPVAAAIDPAIVVVKQLVAELEAACTS